MLLFLILGLITFQISDEMGSHVNNCKNVIRKFPNTLKEFGYAFNPDGVLKKIDVQTNEPGDKGFDFNVSDDPKYNQEHYEALGESITKQVYQLLCDIGLKKINISNQQLKESSYSDSDSTTSCAKESTSTFIFANKLNLSNSKKLLILIHGSGVVRAGQWARSLIINQSINHGTQIPYVLEAMKRGYDVLITNSNHNHYISSDGTSKPIPGHSSATLHGTSVWRDVVMPANPESIAIVAHSYGGVVTTEIAKHFPEFFEKKVFAIAFTDAVYSSPSPHLIKITRNWVASQKPTNTHVDSKLNDISRYSAGHPKHEWTSWACMNAVFEYFNRKYDEFSTNQPVSNKKTKMDL